MSLLTCEIKARWCYECGMDLSLSDHLYAVSERVVLCDICGSRPRALELDLAEVEEDVFDGQPYGWSSRDIWDRFRRRILVLRDDEEIDERWSDLLGDANRAIQRRDARGLLQAISSALDDHPCVYWRHRLHQCRTECEQLLPSSR